MHNIRYSFVRFGSLLHFLLVPVFFAQAQQADSAQLRNNTKADTGFEAKLQQVREAGIRDAQKSILKFRNDRNALRQEDLVEAIKLTVEKAKTYIKGIDTLSVSQELYKVEEWSKASGDGIFYNAGTAQTYRNLTTTGNILRELSGRLTLRKTFIDKQERELLGYRYRVDSLSADTALYDFSGDSAIVLQYLQKLVVAVYTINPVDSAISNKLAEIRSLQTRINTQLYRLNINLEHVEEYQRKLSLGIFDREFPDIWGETGYARPFGEILDISYYKSLLVLLFYVQNNMLKVAFLLILIIAATFFLMSLKKIIRDQQLLRNDFAGQLVLRYPFLTAIVLVLNLFQFIFTEPPFIFNAILWISSALGLTIIFRGFISAYWMRVWLIMLLLLILACANNMVLQASRIERWAMLGLSFIGLVAGLGVFIKGDRTQLREKLILYFLALAAVLEAASIIANITGRFNLSKTLLVIGFLNVITGILFLWTVRFINEGLSLASSVYTRQDKKLFYINFERVGEKSPALLYVLLVLGWFVVMGRNVYAFRLLSEPLKNFFFEKRTLGTFEYSISSLLVFFVIVSLAVVISKIVSFFASDKTYVRSNDGQQKRPGLGSWILLIRVSIITVGLLLGLAASGFPMDRITIIIGALGLGVGLGLQTLVNNLISGLIIAFEKPVNVGDVVEVAGQSGSMKSIGFRSSVITSSSGADVIIPNGDLLNAHLINWSLGGGKRKIEIVVGVAYGTDLTQTKELIRTLLDGHEKILKFPPADIQFQQFGNSSIDALVLFWVRDFREAAIVKSEMIMAINKVFEEHKIVIPFPQQDVHIIQPAPAGEG